MSLSTEELARLLLALTLLLSAAHAAGYLFGLHPRHPRKPPERQGRHQGTARAMVRYFNQLGVPFTEEQIAMERDPRAQATRWGIPEEHLAGHGWHTYTLTSADGTVRFEFTHNVNGREIYALGTIDALLYLHARVAAGECGRMFTMIDVLKGS